MEDFFGGAFCGVALSVVCGVLIGAMNDARDADKFRDDCEARGGVVMRLDQRDNKQVCLPPNLMDMKLN